MIRTLPGAETVTVVEIGSAVEMLGREVGVHHARCKSSAPALNVRSVSILKYSMSSSWDGVGKEWFVGHFWNVLSVQICKFCCISISPETLLE